MKIVTRAGWKASRSRGSLYTVTWAARTEFVVHHTAGPRSQTVKQIQAFHQGPSRGWSDVGYNFLVDEDGQVFEGRGWLAVGAHCPDHNRSGIGVAYIGNNDPTPQAQASIRRLYDEACRKAGRKLRMRGHGQLYATSCPGPRLQKWVNDGMPSDAALPKPDISWTEKLVKDLPLLKPGADSYDVKTVRWLLGARGRPPGNLSSTKFDEPLVADVKEFQKAEDLDVDGLVGKDTWTALLRVA